jgi:prephenate dehydratase
LDGILEAETMEKITVAFQGEPGAFSEDAARKLLGERAEPVPYRSFDEMFQAVTKLEADAALAPIENTLAGSIHQNYDLMMAHNLTIVGEEKLRIVHNLIGLPGADLAGLRRVYSHPVALAQCCRFLGSNPQIQVESAYDTAGSVKMIVEAGLPDQAAIAGRSAAEVYGGSVIAEGIEDNVKNFTRFFLLTTEERAAAIIAATPQTPRKTSIVFRVANTPGSLFRAIGAFAMRDVDLLKIESRPIEGRPWEYSFYVDLDGDCQDPKLDRAIAHLRETAESVRVLGSYPSAT